MAFQGSRDTYQTYKLGTSRIATWLVQTANRAGYDVASNTTPGRASRKSSRKNKAVTSAKHEVPLAQFTPLAQAIAAFDSPKIRIPRSIIAVIKSVINLRMATSALYARVTEQNSSAQRSTADAGHRHFINVLEAVLSILQPAKPDGNTDTATVANLFEALAVQDVEDGDDLPVEQTAKRDKQAAAPTYELEVSPEEELFAIMSFFKDLADVREYIKEVWMAYCNGTQDVMSAAVTTETVYLRCFGEHSSDELRDIVSGVTGHSSLVMRLFERLGLVHVSSDTEEIETSEEFGDFICMPASSLLDDYSDMLDKSRLPVFKPGHFGNRIGNISYWDLQPVERRRDDMIVLLELLPEFTKLARIDLSLPFEDELTAGLRKMMNANSIDGLPMHTVFATQILLDIHHVMRISAFMPWVDLQATGRHVIATLDSYFRYSQQRSVSSWPKENDVFFRKLRDLAQEWTQEDKIGKHPISRTTHIPPKPFHLLKNQPVLAGLLIFYFNMQLNDGGLQLCNGWGTVVYPAHLYNAIQQGTGFTQDWDDMDYILDTHSPSRIFVGTPPTEPQDFLKRFTLALGVSASNFARNRRPGGMALITASKKGPRGLKTTSPVKYIFREKFIAGGPINLSPANVIAMLAVATKTPPIGPTSIDVAELSTMMAAQKQFTTLQLLTAVREGIASEELHLKFDYIGLHLRNSKLLRKLQTHLHTDLVRYFMEEYIEDESQLPFVIGYVFEVVAGSNRVSEDLRLANGGSRMLRTAAEVVWKFLEDEGAATLVKNSMDRSDFAMHSSLREESSEQRFMRLARSRGSPGVLEH
ncbi:hypothetical protein LTR86_002683 [Recurvomyces mirabilis]|nr:hypothetical protein LTR86_002683 [Recurvomyces mirabilis]